MIAVLRRRGTSVLPAAVAILAGLFGAALAAVMLSLQTKYTVALLGLLAVTLVALISGRPRQVLLGISILLLPLNVETNVGYSLPHLAGAPGLVITAQMALLVPLFLLAVVENAANARASVALESQDSRPASLSIVAIVVPLVPLLGSLPSMLGTDYVDLGRYEVIRLFSFYLLYLYMVITFRPGDIKLIVGALLVGILGQLPIAALEYVKPDFHPQIFGQVSGVKEELLGATGASVSRISGTLTHPNELGSYLILLLPMAMLFGVAKPVGFRLRLLAWLALIAGMGMLALTFSRGSWVGAAVGLPLALILAAAYRQIPAGQVVFLLAAGLLTGTVVLLSPPVLNRLLESDPLNVTFRFQIAQVALNMWQSQPFTGVGLNSFVEHARAFDVDHIAILSSGGTAAGTSPPSLPVHNVYLMWLAEIGVIGALGWLAYLTWVVTRSFRAMTSSVPLGPLLAIGFLAGGTALYVGDLASFTSRIDPVMQTFLIILGVVVALGLRRDATTIEARNG